jgi:hypothetical protein
MRDPGKHTVNESTSNITMLAHDSTYNPRARIDSSYLDSEAQVAYEPKSLALDQYRRASRARAG